MMKLELMVNGETKTYTSKFINLKMMRDATNFMSKNEQGLYETDELFDEAIMLVASFFEDEVTYESIMEGISPDDFQDKIMDIIFKVIDGETKKSGKSSRLVMMEKMQKEMQNKMMEEESSKDS